MFYLDLEKLFEKQSEIYSFFTTNISNDEKPSDSYNGTHEYNDEETENKYIFQLI
jgi:hypothetical protein